MWKGKDKNLVTELIKMKKSKGESTSPWGIPALRHHTDDSFSFSEYTALGHEILLDFKTTKEKRISKTTVFKASS